MRPFQSSRHDHQFNSNAQFLSLSRLYEFDRKLRLLVIDALERVEVGVRANICNHMGPKYGAHWYLDSSMFIQRYKHSELLTYIGKKQKQAEIDYKRECVRIDSLKGATQLHRENLKQTRRQESYARHYQLTYSKPELMPNWAMAEELTLGQLSHLYKGLRYDADKKAIARNLGLPIPLMESWLHTLTVIRNYCAHHSRLWNRELGIKPARPRNKNFSWPSYLVGDTLHTRLSVVLAILHHQMIALAPHANWHERLIALFDQYPEINKNAMGLVENWQNDPFWQS